MSIRFGAIRQNGYVVPNIEAAIQHWADKLAIGPWYYVPSVRPKDFLYKGKPSNPEIAIAMAFSGTLQIELIQPLDDAASAYRDFLQTGQQGLQHVSSWPDDYDAILNRFIQEGGQVVQSGRIGGTRFAYLGGEGHPGTIFEIADLDDRSKALFESIRQAAETWDGSNPIRTGW